MAVEGCSFSQSGASGALEHWRVTECANCFYQCPAGQLTAGACRHFFEFCGKQGWAWHAPLQIMYLFVFCFLDFCPTKEGHAQCSLQKDTNTQYKI